MLLIAAGVVVGTVVGFLVERGLLRPMYGRNEIVLVLVTYAAFLVFEDLIKLVWGVDPYFAYQPYALLGRISIGGIGFAVYDLGLLALAILGIAACGRSIKRSRASCCSPSFMTGRSARPWASTCRACLRRRLLSAPRWAR